MCRGSDHLPCRVTDPDRIIGIVTTATRPRLATALAAVVGFLAVTALGGGTALVIGIEGARPPGSWLEDIPLVDSWIVPGLVLGVGFGVGSIIVAWGLLRRPRLAVTAPLERITGRHWSWTGALALGIGHAAWIGLEFLWLPGVSWLMVVYGIVALTIVVLTLTPAVRRHLAIPTSGT